MNVRIAAFLVAITALAGFFGAQRALDNGAPTDERAPAASRASAAAARIQLLEQKVRDNPDDRAGLTQLASTYVQRARETGDPAYYGLADKAVERALKLDANDVQTLIVAGELALARHDFEHALVLGERARAISPDIVAAYGVITDALVELGRYEEATAAAQMMIDLRPDFASYSRASYVRELHGDVGGAIAAMRQAAGAASGLGFDEAWALVIVGNLHLQQGDVAGAERAYKRAEGVLPGDAMVNAALARVAIARGDHAAAETLLRDAVAQRPLPEYAIALGDLLSSQDRAAEADEQYALVRATQQLLAQNGVDTGIELALFDADHGVDPAGTYDRALAAYGRRPGIFAADAVAWAAYKAGRIDDAQRYSDEALRLGTRDPRLAYHAGVIARAAGDGDAAEAHLRAAVAMEPAQSLPYAAAARQALDSLTAEVSGR